MKMRARLPRDRRGCAEAEAPSLNTASQRLLTRLGFRRTMIEMTREL
jgi:RimJ/RimL family protein N-acetyltransferase